MAGVGVGDREELKSLLEKLHLCIPRQNEDITGDANAARDVMVDISEFLAAEMTPTEYELNVSLLFESGGILTFGRNVAKEQEFADVKRETLSILNVLLKKDVQKITTYLEDIQKFVLYLYNVDKAAKVRSGALETFCSLLQRYSGKMKPEDLNMDTLIEMMYVDIRKAKGSTVLQQQLRTLGMLSFAFPQLMTRQANLILKIFKDQIVRHTDIKPDLTALAGTLQGLALYLVNFPSGLDDDPALYKWIYTYVHKVINPNLNLPRREAQRAGLELLRDHNDKFSAELLEHYDTLFPWLLQWCNSANRDDHKVALPTMDSFLITLSNLLEIEGNSGKGKQIFRYLINEYKKLLDGGGTSSQVSLVVKGYGLLSGACRQFLTPADVHTMFSQVLGASQHAFYQSEEMIDSKILNLPSYIESLAIIIRNLEMVNDGILQNVLKLALSLVEHFPSLSVYKHFLAFRSLFTLFHAVSLKHDVQREFMHSFVYHSLVLSCSYAPEFDAVPGGRNETWKKSDNGWKGLRNEVVTYHSFIPLWKALLMQSKVSAMKIIGIPTMNLTMLSGIIYSQFSQCLLEIIEKLDLATHKGDENFMEADLENLDEAVTADPVSGLKAKTPKDFQIYLSLVSLMENLLPLQSEEHLEPHVVNLSRFFIQRSMIQPLVSSHYSALSTILKAAQHTTFFLDVAIPEVATVVQMYTSYICRVLQRCCQFRDQLLAACLDLVFHLPLCIVTDIFSKLIPALQIALQMGVSYLPLAIVCIAALQTWLNIVPREVLHAHLPQVLPCLLPYLRSQESQGDAQIQTRIIAVKMAFANQRRKVDQRKLLESKKYKDSEMHHVQMSVLKLIGSLDPELSVLVIPQDPESLAAAAVRWDTNRHIKFALPFADAKIDMYLDDILPQVIELAMTSSDRQAKVAASELLHSMMILMIGNGAHTTEELRSKHPMAPLYCHIFKGALKLACDPDQVTRQLFITLVYQTIHWFTNNSNFENPDTVVLLEAIMEGIVTPNEPALRDVSAQCLAEFVKWSRKQSRLPSQNFKSILKRIFSLCRHPSAYKRIGGCLAWNSIYREIREDSRTVDEFSLQILFHLLIALDLAETDDIEMGTQTQAELAISHVERIIVERSQIFNQESVVRDVPNGFGNGTLCDVVPWLFEQIGRPRAFFRHSCMQLFVSLAAKAKGVNSAQDFISKKVEIDGMSFVLNVIEGGTAGGHLGVRDFISQGTLFTQATQTKHFYESLLASLDCYAWLLSQQLMEFACLLLNEKCSIWTALDQFVNHVRECTAGNDVMKNYQGAVKLRCTVIVRTLDMCKVLLDEGGDIPNILTSSKFWRTGMHHLITAAIINPTSLGFDLTDLEVHCHLPDRLLQLLQVMARRLHKDASANFVSHLNGLFITPEFQLKLILGSDVSSHDLSLATPRTKCFVEGLELLLKSGWLAKCDMFSLNLAVELCNWLYSCIFKESLTGSAAVFPTPREMPFLATVLSLAFSLDVKVSTTWLDWATDTKELNSHDSLMKGTHVLDVFGDQLLPHLMLVPQKCTDRCLQLCGGGHFTTGLTFASRLCNLLLRNSELRKMHSRSMTESFLAQWPSFVVHSQASPLHRQAVMSLLLSLILIDREGVIKHHCCQTNSSVVVFCRQLLTDSSDLQTKNEVLTLLPFLLNTSDETERDIVMALETLSSLHFPLQSSEFAIASSRDQEYHRAIIHIVTALELSGSRHLLQFIARLFCREDKHRYEDLLLQCLGNLMKRISIVQQLQLIKYSYQMFEDANRPKQNARLRVMELIVIPLMQYSSVTAALQFFSGAVRAIINGIGVQVVGRSADQLPVLVGKIGHMMLVQVMYSKLPKGKVFGKGAEVNMSFSPSDSEGKEMTKEVFRHAAKVAKGELRHDRTHAELRRVCACAAYAALISVLTCVQNDLKFYTNFLFTENATKGESIWESMIDCTVEHKFDIEVQFNPAGKQRFVALRRAVKEAAVGAEGGVVSGTVPYLASHYLADSSLREDGMSQFDFSYSVVLPLANDSHEKDENVSNDAVKQMESELETIKLDQSDYNGHEVMANLTGAVNYLVESGILVLPAGDAAVEANQVPQWMTIIRGKLENFETQRNVKLFLLRLMINTASVWAPFAAHFINAVLGCLVDATLGEGINYFVADVIVMIMNWGKGAILDDSILGCNLASQVLLRLCTNTPHVRADVYKYNLEMTRSVVECWRKRVKIPYDVIYSLLEVRDGRNREKEAGLQLLGIVLVNGFDPYPPEGSNNRYERMLICLLSDHYSDVYCAAAEVIGLTLKHKNVNVDSDTFTSSVVNKLTELLQRSQAQALTCVYNIQKHFPAIVGRFINKLLMCLPKLYGIYRTRVLECLVSYSATMENVFIHLKQHRLLDTLSKREPSTQLVALRLVNAVASKLTGEELTYFMPGILSFASHPAPACRQLMYDILFSICGQYNDTNENELETQARTALLMGVTDEDAALRQIVLNFWLNGSKYLTLPDRLTYILTKMYTPESELNFLQSAVYVLLEATQHAPDYTRNMFDTPLTECKFIEMKVNTAWQARHSSMIPLFTDSVAMESTGSVANLILMTQGSVVIDMHSLGNVAATQANIFSLTQQPETYNWMTESTFDTTMADQEFAVVNKRSQGATTGLIFTSGSSGGQLAGKGIGLGKSYFKSGDETDSSTVETSHSRLARRRFVKNQDREKQTQFFARQEERRSKLRTKLHQDRQQQRESKVTMHRQYRVGELPDVQIPYRALISPLLAVAQQNKTMARLLFGLVVQGILDHFGIQMESRNSEMWTREIRNSINSILSSSFMYNPDMVKSMLQLVLDNDIKVDTQVLTNACLSSQLECLGSLVLERQILTVAAEEQPPKRARSELSVRGYTAQWLAMTELYKSVNMWDVVQGILKTHISNLKKETVQALEAEAANKHIDAFVMYSDALAQTKWDEDPSAAEVHIWEESYCTCAVTLGLWPKLESFVENRFLRETPTSVVDLDMLWKLPRPGAVALPAIVHSKLMNVLSVSKNDDGGLCAFVDRALKEPHHRTILEGELALQLAILAVNQQDFMLASAHLQTSLHAALQKLVHFSLMMPKPLVTSIRGLQLTSELQDFLQTMRSPDDAFAANGKKLIKNWQQSAVNCSDSSLFLQCLASYRDLYAHFIGDRARRLNDEDLESLVISAKASTHCSVARIALQLNNFQVAFRHTVKAKGFTDNATILAEIGFLEVQTIILKGELRRRIQPRCLADAYAKLKEVQNLKLIHGDQKMRIKVLQMESHLNQKIYDALCTSSGEETIDIEHLLPILNSKFPGMNGVNTWQKELLHQGFNYLKEAVNIAEMIPSKTSEITISNTDVLLALARFCEDCLEKYQVDISGEELSEHMIRSLLKAMALGSHDAHFRFPRLIVLLDDYPDLSPTFKKESENVPAWMFLLWISHILIYIDQSPGSALISIIERLAMTYPQSVYFPFNVSRQQYNFCCKEGQTTAAACARIDAILSPLTLLKDFTDAISLVASPSIRCKDLLSKLVKVKGKQELVDGIMKLSKEYLPTGKCNISGKGVERGEVYFKLGKHRSEAKKLLENALGPNLKKMKLTDEATLKSVVRETIKVWQTPAHADSSKRLTAYSPWLSAFHYSMFTQMIEVPGQYTGLKKPLPEYHAKIASFDDRLLHMLSIRRPMRLIIRGDNEIDYKFLVKAGEDLRTDQRIEQMFTLMNHVFLSSPLCSGCAIRPFLEVYSVVPLTLDMGILQWVDSTQPLQDFMTLGQAGVLDQASKIYSDSESWVPEKMASREKVIKVYMESVNKVPWDLLRNQLFKLANSMEAYFCLRSTFAVTFGTICISHWLLGIGDRHTGNFLISLKTGRVVGIDFGHNFESATQFLPVPELMPFRMTPQIVNVLQPHGTAGFMRETMISTYGALKEAKHILLSAVEAFIKEPTEDWINFVQLQSKNYEVAEAAQVDLFSQERMNMTKLKLGEINPVYITLGAMKKNRRLKDASQKFLEKVIVGRMGQDVRAIVGIKSRLTTPQQVDCLIELATDPNILGRTYIGWKPFC